MVICIAWLGLFYGYGMGMVWLLYGYGLAMAMVMVCLWYGLTMVMVMACVWLLYRYGHGRAMLKVLWYGYGIVSGVLVTRW